MAEHRHWRQDKNSPYLAATDMLEADMIVKIADVKIGDVFNPGSKQTEKKRIIEFEGGIKPMICNEVNGKMIEKVIKSGFYDEWVGHKLQLYAAPNERSESGFAIRVRDFEPK